MLHRLFRFFSNNTILHFLYIQILSAPNLYAQEKPWPITVYGGNGASYESSPEVTGYILVNNKSLKGLIHRTYMKGSLLDTLLNSDTLYGRIKMFIPSKMIDVELSNENVLSIPCTYITSIVGNNFPKPNIPTTSWKILYPNAYLPFGRLIARKGEISLYDWSKYDTTDHRYLIPITLHNGKEEIKISCWLCSTNRSLKKFIRKRYKTEPNLSKKNMKNNRLLMDFILNQEEHLVNKK